MTMHTVGQTEVAQWCHVRPQTVAMWIIRDEHHDYPEPDADIRNGAGIVRGWLPGRRAEWEAYAAKQAAKPGALLVAQRRDRKGK